MKTFVINNKDKWEDIKIDFADTNIKLIKWNIPKYKDPTKYATKICNTFCSYNTINRWLAHRSLWRYIYKNKEKYAIILEDDAVPIDNFENKLQTILAEAPKDWDILYIGCTGSCDINSFADEVLATAFSSKNRYVYKDNKLCEHIIKPGFPLGTYAYILSYKGAKKLLYDDNLKQVSCDLSYALCKYVVNNDNYEVYAAIPPLIYMDFDADKNEFVHKLIKPIAEYVKVSNQLDMYDVLNMVPIHYRQLDIRITYFAIILFLMAFIVGYFASKNNKKYFTITLTTYLLADMIYSKSTKSILAEIIFVIIFILLGNKISQYAKP